MYLWNPYHGLYSQVEGQEQALDLTVNKNWQKPSTGIKEEPGELIIKDERSNLAMKAEFDFVRWYQTYQAIASRPASEGSRGSPLSQGSTPSQSSPSNEGSPSSQGSLSSQGSPSSQESPFSPSSQDSRSYRGSPPSHSPLEVHLADSGRKRRGSARSQDSELGRRESKRSRVEDWVEEQEYMQPDTAGRQQLNTARNVQKTRTEQKLASIRESCDCRFCYEDHIIKMRLKSSKPWLNM